MLPERDTNIGYRVNLLEEAVGSLSETTKELVRFMTEMRVWLKLMAWISGLVALAVSSLIVKIIFSGISIG